MTKVATGYNHTVCIDEAGKVYTWGAFVPTRTTHAFYPPTQDTQS